MDQSALAPELARRVLVWGIDRRAAEYLDSDREVRMPMSIYALAATDIQANSIIIALGSIGFLVDDLSVLLRDGNPLGQGAHEPPHQPSEPPPAAGGADGAAPVIGGALGWITGISRLTIPGLGQFIAAGPIKALLNGTVLGQVDGDVAGALIGLGLPKAEAHRYEGRIRDGRILIIAHSDKSAWIAKATQVLREAGAEDIGSSHEESTRHASATDGVAPPADEVYTAPSGATAPRTETHALERVPPAG